MTGVFIRGKKDHDTQRAREAAMRRRRQRLGAGGGGWPHTKQGQELPKAEEARKRFSFKVFG